MVTLEEIARTALAGDALATRSMVQDWLGSGLRLAEVGKPLTGDELVLAASAGLVEMLAERSGQVAPVWTKEVGGVAEARYLLKSAATMKRLRRMCEEESPMPLRRRNLFAPANYLSFV